MKQLQMQNVHGALFIFQVQENGNVQRQTPQNLFHPWTLRDQMLCHVHVLQKEAGEQQDGNEKPS